MPLIEVTQNKQITATIRLDEGTAEQVDQYAAFIRASADEVIDKALIYVFSKDREFQEYLRTADATSVASTLRVRKSPQPESSHPNRSKSTRSMDAPKSTSNSKSETVQR